MIKFGHDLSGSRPVLRTKAATPANLLSNEEGRHRITAHSVELLRSAARKWATVRRIVGYEAFMETTTPLTRLVFGVVLGCAACIAQPGHGGLPPGRRRSTMTMFLRDRRRSTFGRRIVRSITRTTRGMRTAGMAEGGRHLRWVSRFLTDTRCNPCRSRTGEAASAAAGIPVWVLWGICGDV